MTFLEFVNEKGYSIRGIAKKAGINYRSLEQYGYCRYALRNMRPATLVRLADALEVTPKELLELDVK